MPRVDDIRRVAEERFGWARLRDEQVEAMEDVLAGHDVLAVLPTGAGKSAIYQVPAVLLDGPTLVVSPLIAQQHDQIDGIEDSRGRRRGKSDPINAHLAAVGALGLDSTRLPTPRADGDREALRILLGARQELTTTKTRQINRLRALLLTGDDIDRALARAALTAHALTTLAQRRARRDETREQAVRRNELRRLARSINHLAHEHIDNKHQLSELVTAWHPRSSRPSESVPSAQPKRSCPGLTQDAVATKPPTPP